MPKLPTLPPATVYALATDAGLSHERAIIATAVSWPESGLAPAAEGDKTRVGERTRDGRTWGLSIGLWQVRSIDEDRRTGSARDPDALYDAAHNARAMAEISNGGADFSPWTTFRTGEYLQYVDQVRAAVESGGPMKFVSRAEWGAEAPRADHGPHPHPLTKLACHWVGPGAGWPWDHSECAGRVLGIQRFHKYDRGWNDIAYNAVVCPHGYVFEGRGYGMANAANGGIDGDGSGHGDNHEYVAVCYLGGEGDPFTDEAKDAFNDAGDWLDISSDAWAGHQDLVSTGCPGPEILSWVRAGHPRTTTQEDKLTQEQADTLRYVADVLTEVKNFIGKFDPEGKGDWWRGQDEYVRLVKG